MYLNMNLCLEPDKLYNYKDNSKIIFIGDCSDEEFIKSVKGIPATLFNPPFEAINANIDGNYIMFNNIYINYLNNNSDVNDFIIAIIQVCAVMGVPVILYLNKNEYDLYYEALNRYLNEKYGLMVGNPYLNIPSQINDLSLQNLIQYMYMNDHINVETFLKLNQLPYTNAVISKLIINLGLEFTSNLNLSTESYIKIFNDYKENLINEGRIKRQPLIRNY